MYIEESFNTIINMDYGSGKSPMGERVKKSSIIKLPFRDTIPSNVSKSREHIYFWFIKYGSWTVLSSVFWSRAHATHAKCVTS